MLILEGFCEEYQVAFSSYIWILFQHFLTRNMFPFDDVIV